MIDKFVQLLNHKKRKNLSLEHRIKTVEETNEKLTEENEQLKKRKRDDEQDMAEVRIVHRRITKQQTTVKEETRSLPLPAVADQEESSDYCGSDDDIDYPQTVR